MKVFDPKKTSQQAVKIFTDREAPRAAFWNLYNTM